MIPSYEITAWFMAKPFTAKAFSLEEVDEHEGIIAIEIIRVSR